MKNRLRRLGALLLTAALLCTLLSACTGNTTPVVRDDFDVSLYEQINTVEGCSFIVPKEYYEGRYSYDDYGSYSAAEKKKHSFEWIGEKNWSVFREGTFGCYGFDIGTIDHIEGKEDVNTLARYLRIDDYITFSPWDDGGKMTTKSNTDTGDIQNIYPVIIRDTLTGDDYFGYLSTYRLGANRYVYAVACGFAKDTKANRKTGRTVAESLKPDSYYLSK